MITSLSGVLFFSSAQDRMKENKAQDLQGQLQLFICMKKYTQDSWSAPPVGLWQLL